MILSRQYPDEPRRTSRGCAYKIDCEINGINYSASSRSGAPYALARVLVAAGIEDQPMTVFSTGLAGETRYKSIYRMAGYTVAENASQPVHVRRYVAYSRFPGGGVATDE